MRLADLGGHVGSGEPKAGDVQQERLSSRLVTFHAGELADAISGAHQFLMGFGESHGHVPFIGATAA
jgi:hypothetical protein